MNTLLHQNATGVFTPGPGGRGFLCRVPVRTASGVVSGTVRCKGLTKFVNRWCPRKTTTPQRSASATAVRPAGRTRTAAVRTVKLFTLPIGVRPISSSLAMGGSIHRHVMHRLMCTQSGVCRCQTPPPPSASPSVHACVDAARSFTQNHGIVPWAGEQIIFNRSGAGIATQPDAFFIRAGVPKAENSPIMNISWKSGAGPRDPIELQRHEMQVAFECGTLEQWHGVKVEAAYIVYLCAGQTASTKRIAGYYHCHRVTPQRIAALYSLAQDKMKNIAARKARNAADPVKKAKKIKK